MKGIGIHPMRGPLQLFSRGCIEYIDLGQVVLTDHMPLSQSRPGRIYVCGGPGQDHYGVTCLLTCLLHPYDHYGVTCLLSLWGNTPIMPLPTLKCYNLHALTIVLITKCIYITSILCKIYKSEYKEIVYKFLVVGCWCGCLSGAMCRQLYDLHINSMTYTLFVIPDCQFQKVFLCFLR